jgi:hypothetical protein
MAVVSVERMRYDFTFYLGVHQANWLWNASAKGPVFIAVHRMQRKAPFPRATVPFALDSGGYNHLLREGRWTTSAAQYVDDVWRIREETGQMRWAAIQDWVCSPDVLARTGKTVLDHQKLTIESWHELRHRAGRVQWLPVLQGVTTDDYLRHLEMYEESGTPLVLEPLVGVGSVAPRQAEDEVVDLMVALQGLGLKLHAFGIKLQGVRRLLPYLQSSDSMAWSWHARKNGGDPNGQDDAEAYRRLMIAEVAEMERHAEFVQNEGVLAMFGEEN